MPTIYLKHPQHGTKVAIVEQEAVYDEANGWVRYDPMTPAPVVVPAKAPVKPEAPRPISKGI